MNVVMIVGSLVKDPELKYTPAGLPICEFQIEDTEERSGKVTIVHVPVTAFGELAENIAENARRSDLIEVVGRLNVRERTSAAGKTFTDTSVVAGKAKVLVAAGPKTPRMVVDDEALSELPF